jgi:predicted RND superfamily exporter protein
MFYQTELDGQDTYIDAIKEIRDVFAASGLPSKSAFPWGATFTYWSIFLELQSILLRTLAIDTGLVFVLSLVLLQSFTSALASTLACGMVVTMVYGVVTLFTKFNFFVVASLLASAGLSVEFTSHLIVSYNMLEGPLEERLGLAMSHTIPPLFQGAISTFLSMLPLAFHDIKFVMKYFFGVFSVLVAVGLLTGLVLLPALLALLSPISDALSGKSHRSNARAAHPDVQEGQVQGSPSEQLPNLMPDSKAAAGDFSLRKRPSKEQAVAI